jgi:hypothetical protein
MLEQVLPASLFAALLSFARVGSAMPAGAPRLVALIGGCGRDSRIPDHRRPPIW